MPHDVSTSSGKIIFLSLSIACLVSISHGAVAAPAAGCDPKVMKAMKAKADAAVAYDVAVTEQIVTQPDSVLATTCFNQAAGVSAKKAGEIFSKDFTAELTPIITDALQDLYGEFDDAEGSGGGGGGGSSGSAGAVDYAATDLSDTFNCNEMEDLWKRAETAGTAVDVPYADFDEIVSGTPPAGAGDDFLKDWEAASTAGAFKTLKETTEDLPQPSIPDLSHARSSCEVLLAAGITTEPCPN